MTMAAERPHGGRSARQGCARARDKESTTTARLVLLQVGLPFERLRRVSGAPLNDGQAFNLLNNTLGTGMRRLAHLAMSCSPALRDSAVVSFLLSILLVGCKGDLHSSESETRRTGAGGEVTEWNRIEQLPENVVPLVSLHLAGVISLGTDSSSTVATAERTKLGRNMVYVADSRWLRAFDRAGKPRFTISIGSGGTSQLRVPIGMATIGDTLLALDIDWRRGITVVDPKGSIARQVPLKVGTSTVDLAPIGRNIALATVTANLIDESSASIVRVVGNSGAALYSGCDLDPRYRESQKEHGLVAMFRGVSVYAWEGQLYCRQAITPIVQVLDSTGRLRGVVRLAPPFYQRPSDTRESMNQLTVNKFRSSWWEHKRFYARPAGFASVYETYDSTASQDRYRVFGCDSTTQSRKCYVADLPGTPVDFVPPDTIVIAEPRRSLKAAQRLLLLKLPQ